VRDDVGVRMPGEPELVRDLERFAVLLAG